MPDAGYLTSLLNNYIRGAGFMTAIANINWSRGYGWYVALDDVPAPFHKQGIIGLPVTDVNFSLASTNEFSWEAGIQKLYAPQSRDSGEVTLTMYDDEQQTLFTFFERWFNLIYNPYEGVLPLDEACKSMSIFKLKSTRQPVKRYPVSYDANSSTGNKSFSLTGLWTSFQETMSSGKSSMDLLVYPIGDFSQSLQCDSGSSNPMTFQVKFRIALQETQDFGDPKKVAGSASAILGDNILSSALDRIADYI